MRYTNQRTTFNLIEWYQIKQFKKENTSNDNKEDGDNEENWVQLPLHLSQLNNIKVNDNDNNEMILLSEPLSPHIVQNGSVNINDNDNDIQQQIYKYDDEDKSKKRILSISSHTHIQNIHMYMAQTPIYHTQNSLNSHRDL